MKKQNKKKVVDITKLSIDELKTKRNKLYKKSLRMLMTEGLLTGLTILSFVFMLIFRPSSIVIPFLIMGISTTCTAGIMGICRGKVDREYDKVTGTILEKQSSELTEEFVSSKKAEKEITIECFNNTQIENTTNINNKVTENLTID